ncbi:MAG: hypothetical protein ACO3ZG_02260 [Kiritimatiellia bacterium]
MKNIWITMIMLTVAVVMTNGCGKKEAAEKPAGQVPASADVFAGLYGSVDADQAEAITTLKTKAKPGEAVILVGKVMGMMEPFVPNRAAFVVGDEEVLVSCDLLGDDGHCPTPWDLCCDDPEAIRAGTATIQVVDETGAVLKREIRGVNGLKELSRMRVQGVVAPQSSDEVLIINAERIELL